MKKDLLNIFLLTLQIAYFSNSICFANEWQDSDDFRFSRPFSSSANDSCEDFLLSSTEISFQIGTQKEVEDTIQQSKDAFLIPRLIVSAQNPFYAQIVLKVHMNYIELLLKKLHQQYQIDLVLSQKQKNKRNKLYNQMTAKLKTASDFERTFNRPDTARLYSRFFSTRQRYFSAMLITYGILRSDLDLDSHLRVLELGPGAGDSTRIIRRLLPHATILAFDKSAVFLKHLQKQHLKEDDEIAPDNLHFFWENTENPSQNDDGLKVIPYQYDFKSHNFPLPDGSQDFVVSIAAAAQYLKPREFFLLLKDVYKVLRPGGYFIFDFGPHLRSRKKGTSLEQYLEMIRDAGFETEKHIGMNFKLNGPKGTFHLFPILLRRP